jgi:hypothetical protein
VKRLAVGAANAVCILAMCGVLAGVVYAWWVPS